MAEHLIPFKNEQWRERLQIVMYSISIAAAVVVFVMMIASQ